MGLVVARTSEALGYLRIGAESVVALLECCCGVKGKVISIDKSVVEMAIDSVDYVVIVQRFETGGVSDVVVALR